MHVNEQACETAVKLANSLATTGSGGTASASGHAADGDIKEFAFGISAAEAGLYAKRADDTQTQDRGVV